MIDRGNLNFSLNLKLNVLNKLEMEYWSTCSISFSFVVEKRIPKHVQKFRPSEMSRVQYMLILNLALIST